MTVHESVHFGSARCRYSLWEEKVDVTQCFQIHKDVIISCEKADGGLIALFISIASWRTFTFKRWAIASYATDGTKFFSFIFIIKINDVSGKWLLSYPCFKIIALSLDLIKTTIVEAEKGVQTTTGERHFGYELQKINRL